MTATNFPTVLKHTLRHEGGYVDHPRDPAGATNLGVTIGTLRNFWGRPVTKAEVRALTVADVTPIYKRGYWDAVRADHLRDGLDAVTFDAAVNSGPSRGARWTQGALGVAADGKIGPVTLNAQAKFADMVPVIQNACARRMGFLRGLNTFDVFGGGWSRRVAELEAFAVHLSAGESAARHEGERASTKANREAATGGGAAASGGGTVSLTDVPDWGMNAIIAVAVVVAVVFVYRAVHDKRRAKAYRESVL